jgi:hypothetical protein
MWRIGLVLVLLAACGGGGEGGGDLFGVRARQFAFAACDNTCITAELRDECVDQVEIGLDSVRALLDNQTRCLACLRAKSEIVPEIVANDCQLSREIEMTLSPACDLDPNQDSNFDGIDDNDLEDTCLGAGSYPFLFGPRPPEGDPEPL